MALHSGADMEGHTGAMSDTWEDAALGALGECIERYCCAVQPDDLIVATARELGDAAIDMHDFQLFSQVQYDHPDFPFAVQTPDLPITWVETKTLHDGTPRFVPACLVYIPYNPKLPNDTDMLGLSVSSGQACHSTHDRAVLSGLYEVIERDAFMLTWARRLTPTRLTLDGSPSLQSYYDEFFDGCSLTFDLFRLPSDIDVPSVLCVARGETTNGPFACVGAATRLNEDEAARKAMVEAAQGAVWVRDLIITKPDWKPEPHYANVREFEDHVRLYANPEMMVHLDFLYEGPVRPVGTGPDIGPAEAVDTVVERVRQVGLDPILVDITTREVAEHGLHVVRAMIPGVAELYAVHGLPTYGTERYETVPKKLGFTADIHQKFNPIPHPFP